MRYKIAGMLAWLACKIKPDHPKVLKFYTDLIRDELIVGHSIVRVNPMEVANEPRGQAPN